MGASRSSSNTRTRTFQLASPASNGTRMATYWPRADPLGNVSGLTPESATRRFVEDVTSNRAIIAVIEAQGSIRDVWITDDIEKGLRHKQPDEAIEFRYWDGTNARRSWLTRHCL